MRTHIIKEKCDEYLNKVQYSFRKASGTRKDTFGLTITTERYLEVQRNIYVYFVDFQKAFEGVKHEKFIEVGLNDIISNLYVSSPHYSYLTYYIYLENSQSIFKRKI